MTGRAGNSATLALLWVSVVAVALAARPLLPVDETRYLAVAWEMWQRGDFLVPYLNGEPYSHKPPLLFWGIHLGWAVFGVNEWWPRLVAPLFGLASLFLTWRLGQVLWPNRPETGPTAAFIVLGSLFWTAFTTVTMFDLLHVCFALAGMAGLVTAVRGRLTAGIMVFGGAIGMGVLAKGPAILIHLLPAALSAPLWAPRLGYSGNWTRWYLGVFAGTILGAAIGLAWAVPAAGAGGEAYRDAILWGQSAGRMVKSFAHDRPVWWYAAVLPLMVLPWVIWPYAWRVVLAGGRELFSDGGIRLCLIWFSGAFIAFSLISGKQPHYLLPEFPALALVLAYALQSESSLEPSRTRSVDLWVPALFFLVLSLALVASALFGLRPSWATSEGDLHGWPALAIAGAALAFLRWGRSTSVRGIAALSVVAVMAVHFAARPLILESHNFRPLAEKLKAWEDAGYAFVTFGKYRGEFHFLGRLSKPIAVVDGPVTLARHLEERDKVKVFRVEKNVSSDLTPDAVLPFRGRLIVVWDADRLPIHLRTR